MALLITCPGCGMTIANNGENCPFCNFNVKANKYDNEEDNDVQAAQTEEAASEEQAQSEVTAEPKPTDAAPVPSGNVVENPNLPDLANGENKAPLPPMQPEQPVPISKIANTPAVPLTPIQAEQINNTLPQWQPQREVTMEQIQRTPAVQLTPIEQEKVKNKLPDINSPEAAPPRSAQAPVQNVPQISVERPSAPPQRPQINVERPSVPPQRPQINVERPSAPPQGPQISVEKPATPIKPTTPRVQQTAPQPPQVPVQPVAPQTPVQPSAPRPKNPWTTESVPEAPQEVSAPKQKKQWSTDSAPAQPPKEKKQWSTEPKPAESAEGKKWSTEPKLAEESPMDAKDREIEELRKKYDQGRNTTPPPEAPRTPVNAPANNAPAQNTPQKKPIVPIIIVAVLVVALIVIVVFALGGNNGEEASQGEGSQSSSASSVSSGTEGSKSAAGATVTFIKPDDWGDTVYAYVYEGDTKNADWPGVEMTNIGDGTYTYTLPDNIANPLILFNDNDTHQYPGKNEEGLTVTDGATYDTGSGAAASEGSQITFTKPDDWSDDVNVYIYIDSDNKIADWPGVPMTKSGDNTYTYDIPSGYEGAYVIFNYTVEGKSKDQYPKRGQGLIAVAGKSYTTETVDEE